MTKMEQMARAMWHADANPAPGDTIPGRYFALAKAAATALETPSQHMLDQMAKSGNCKTETSYAAMWILGARAILTEKTP